MWTKRYMPLGQTSGLIQEHILEPGTSLENMMNNMEEFLSDCSVAECPRFR